MATTPEPAQQPPVRVALHNSKIVSIFVLRLQSSIQQKTAMIVILNKLECNPMLCLFYNKTDVKRTQKLLLSCVVLNKTS